MARNIALITLGLLLTGVAGCAKLHGGLKQVHGQELSELANNDIKESSGLAFSQRSRNILWTHNDSGDMPRIFAFDLNGRDMGVFEIEGARAIDWEDMASVLIGSESYLIIADVGDNTHQRDFYTIYLVREPEIDFTHENANGVLGIAREITFRYEDGPKDCEAVAIEPTTKTIFLVTKTLGAKCKVYSLPLNTVTQGEIVTARVVAFLKINLATAMDISPDGRRAVILTYRNAHEFIRNKGEKWAEAFKRKASVIRMPSRHQGESICYGPDGMTLYLTSEKYPSPLWEVRIPRKIGNNSLSYKLFAI